MNRILKRRSNCSTLWICLVAAGMLLLISVLGVDAEPPQSGERTGVKPAVQDLGGGKLRVGQITIDSGKRTITIPASVEMSEGPVEYLLVEKTRGKIHESVFSTTALPRNVHIAALLLGMKPKHDLGAANAGVKVRGNGAIDISVEWDRNGPMVKRRLSDVVKVMDPSNKNGRSASLARGSWLYNGSIEKAGQAFAADRTGSFISIIRDSESLMNYPGASRDNDEIHEPNAARLPKKGHPVRIVVRIPKTITKPKS